MDADQGEVALGITLQPKVNLTECCPVGSLHEEKRRGGSLRR